jgi:predicted CXXCH cytochrome family protein
MRLPRPEDHRNGTREGRGHRSVNSFHLRENAIVAEPANAWDAQVTVDTFCAQQCHYALVLGRTHRHGNFPVTGAVQLGQMGTRMFGQMLPVPVDSDVTTRALATTPDYAPCFACHDPHGTGAPDGDTPSNKMLRMEWKNDLCRVCHI